MLQSKKKINLKILGKVAENTLRQPRALYILLVNEVWDRFSFYGLQALLVLYLTKAMGFSDKHAYLVYGVYASLAFSAPVVGGWLADRYFGFQRMIYTGLVLLISGNLLMATHSIELFYIGMGIVSTGIGFLKPNNAGLLGHAYHDHDPRRESGFTFFYIATNAGALLGPLCYGVASAQWGWHSAFILSAIGMLSSLIMCFTQHRYLQNLTSKRPSIWLHVGIIFAVIAVSGFMSLMFTHPHVFKYVLGLLVAIVIAFVTYIATNLGRKERCKLIVFIILLIFGICFFACFMQIGSSLMLFIDRFIHLSLFGWHVPTATYASLEPIFVVLLAPLLNPLWQRVSTHQIPAATRISLGLLLGCLSFVSFAFAAWLTEPADMYCALAAVILGNLLLGAGEICIGPALTAAVTYLTPQKRQGTFMGIWLLSVAIAGYLSSLIAQLSAQHHHTTVKALYFQTFVDIAIMAGVITLLMLLCRPLIHRLIPKPRAQSPATN